MNHRKDQLTLDKITTYQIKIPGEVNGGWLSLEETVKLSIEHDNKGQPTTVITCVVDQAALHGVLRDLYAVGLPLQSVIWLEGN